MKKFIVMLVTVMAVTIAFADNFEVGWSQTKTTVMKNAAYQASYDQHPWEFSLSAEYLETNAGYSIYCNQNIDYDYHPYSVFYFGTFNTDTVLGINNRFDLGIGAGWECYNDYASREKISYALIYRDQRILHSLRYKYTYNGPFFDGGIVVFYVTPTEEVRGDSRLGIKISDNLAIGLQHKFLSTEKNNNNISLAYVRVKT